MIDIQKKYLRFFLSETQFRSRLIAVCILLLVIIIQNKMLSSQKYKLMLARDKKAFVMKIPDMEKSILAKTQKPEDFTPRTPVKPEPAPEPPKEPHFEGSGKQEGVLHAVIDGEVLMEGDKIGDYIVKEIGVGSVKLEHIETKEIKEYKFEYAE